MKQICVILAFIFSYALSQNCDFPPTWQGKLTTLYDDWTFADSSTGPEVYYVDQPNNRFRVDSNSSPTSASYMSLLYLGNINTLYITNSTVCHYWVCKQNNVSFPWTGYLSQIPGVSFLGAVLVGDTQAYTYGTPSLSPANIMLAVVTSDSCLPMSLSFISAGQQNGFMNDQFFNVYNKIIDDSVFQPSNNCVPGPSSQSPCSVGHEGDSFLNSLFSSSVSASFSSFRPFSHAFKKFK